MIKEFAVEPALVARWSDPDLRTASMAFGNDRPCILGRLPVDWNARVWEAWSSGASKSTKKRLEVFLEQVGRRAVSRTGVGAGPDWLRQAEAAHASDPFERILAAANPRQRPSVAVDEEIWDVLGRADSMSATPPRTAGGLANCLASLFRFAERVVVVDPYFRESDSEVVRLIFSMAPRLRAPLEILSCNGNNMNRPENFKQRCNAAFSPLIPSGKAVSVVRVRNSTIHDRFVLTNFAGVTIGASWNDNRPAETHNVNLLGQHQFALRWSEFVGMNPSIKIEYRFTISGC